MVSWLVFPDKTSTAVRSFLNQRNIDHFCIGSYYFAPVFNVNCDENELVIILLFGAQQVDVDVYESLMNAL